MARQYLGSMGKIDNGIVSVNAYGIYDQIQRFAGLRVTVATVGEPVT